MRPGAAMVSMSGSLPGGPSGIDRVKKVFGITEAPHYVLSPFNGKISVIVSTSIISMGLNIPKCYIVIVLSMWSYYQLIQYMGRVVY